MNVEVDYYGYDECETENDTKMQEKAVADERDRIIFELTKKWSEGIELTMDDFMYIIYNKGGV